MEIPINQLFGIIEAIRLNTIPDENGNSLVLLKCQFKNYDSLFQRYNFIALYFHSNIIDKNYRFVVVSVDIDGKIT